MKRHITLNADIELLERAKAKGLVISDVLNDALYDKDKPAKQDFSNESLKIVCSECKKEIEQGYRCEWKKIAICDKCHPNFNIKACFKVRGSLEHIHSRFGVKLEPLE